MIGADVDFAPPGPGAWSRATAHFRGPLTGFMRAVYPAAVDDGIRRMARAYGLPVRGQTFGFLHGYAYGQPQLELDPGELVRLDAVAADAVGTSRWRADAARWHEHDKPRLIAANLALQDVDLSSLDDDALAGHLERAAAHFASSVALHFELHGADQIPLGRFLVACADWDLPPADAAAALAGSSPASIAATPDLVEAAGALVRAGAQPVSLGAVREVPGAAAPLERHLRLHGWRMATTYDVDGATEGELPSLTLHAIRRLADGAGARTPGAGPMADGLRARVPARDRRRFDELLVEATATYGLRDDHVGIDFLWPAGLLRRALLEVGTRLTARSLTSEPADAVELAPQEVASALAGAGPGGAELERRRSERRRLARLEPPLRLGEEDAPPLELLPPAVGGVVAAFIAAAGGWFEPPGRTDLSGDGIGSGRYVGRACVVDDPAPALDRLRPGDVLVARFTTPGFNAALAVAGALVTAEGGLFSHAAIAARELGIPAVVGVPGADRSIRDGAGIEVDAGDGTVRVLPH